MVWTGLRWLPAAAWLAAVLLAGCSAEPAPPADLSPEQEETTAVDAETGAIAGVVVDAAVRPVAGAVVRLADQVNSLTDEEGRFSFSYVAPGEALLATEAAGYLPATTSINVVAGQTTDVNVVLELVPIQEPFTEVFQWSGVLLCGIAWTDPVMGNQATSCNGIVRSVPGFPPDLDSSGISIPIGALAGISGLWAELAWSAQSPAAANMEANWGYSVDAERAFFQHVATSKGPSVLSTRIPIEAFYDNLREVESVFCAPEACELYGIPTSSSSLGTPVLDAGGQFEQAFEAFVTVFHQQALPDAYSITAPPGGVR